ncbi:D-2-hydroxyglutarate dehydrogenase, mitochondrial [Holothuria leucospilota]|uniref:D-2-hydroxyglutarate dehydrogenase, mitochondrial n=1 Tax=Holothuria leucospilota TaxID=206669 RepID=A0A9Q0Y9F6_HOLLE|nr:D-2-hydroxyglutarate dehydrogenase, mitochondrial [Holothuria leucospilota]
MTAVARNVLLRYQQSFSVQSGCPLQAHVLSLCTPGGLYWRHRPLPIIICQKFASLSHWVPHQLSGSTLTTKCVKSYRTQMMTRSWSFSRVLQREVPLTSDQYPSVKRGSFSQVRPDDVAFFESVLPGRVVTDSDGLETANTGWMRICRVSQN